MKSLSFYHQIWNREERWGEEGGLSRHSRGEEEERRRRRERRGRRGRRGRKEKTRREHQYTPLQTYISPFLLLLPPLSPPPNLCLQWHSLGKAVGREGGEGGEEEERKREEGSWKEQNGDMCMIDVVYYDGSDGFL